MAAREGLSCPACGGALASWTSVPGGEPADARRYGIAWCASCGSGSTAGEPPAPEAYESGQYSREHPRAAGLVDAFQRAVTRQPVRLLARAGLAPGARVLDVGAGPGRLVAALGAGGYEARGIEPSSRSAGRARAAGLAVEQLSLSQHADADLDAAVMWHVLEHLDDPGAALAGVREWLRPDGLLLVASPNAASLQAEIAGDGWLHWDAPRHRVHFTADGLERLLARSGFRKVRTHHWVTEQNPHAMWFAFLARLGATPSFPFHFLKKNARATPRDLALTAAGIPLIPPAIALEALAALIRRGGTVAVTARRI